MTLTSAAPCKAKDPTLCPYHGPYLRMQEAREKLDFDGYAKASVEFNLLNSKTTARILWEETKAEEGIEVKGLTEDVDPNVERVALALSKYAGEVFQQHHDSALGDHLVISDKIAEILLKEALEKGGIKANLDVGSHKVGADIHVPLTEEGFGLSIKTGTTTKQLAAKTETLRISGSRLGKHESLDDKIDFLKETSPDMYICVSRQKVVTEAKLPSLKEFEYTVYMFPGSVIDLEDSSKWEDKGKVSVFKSKKFKAEIKHSLSDQLWLHVDTKAPGVISFKVPIKK